MANLVNGTSPYLHSSAKSFNIAARQYLPELSGNSTPTDFSPEMIAKIEQKKDIAEKREYEFYRQTLKDEMPAFENCPKVWSEKYLARKGEGKTITQIALNIWNSHSILNTLMTTLSPKGIKDAIDRDETLKKYLGKQYIDNIEKIFIEGATSANVLKELTEIIVGKGLSTQVKIRKLFGDNVNAALNRNKKLTSSKKTGQAYGLLKKYLLENVIDKRSQVEATMSKFSEKLKEEAEIAGVYEEDTYKLICNYFRSQLEKGLEETGELVFRNLFSEKTNVLGSIAEIGDSGMLALQLLLENTNGPITVKDIESIFDFQGQEAVDRFGNKKESKTDIFFKMGQGFGVRFQMKNTDLNLFRGLEDDINKLETNPFFKITSELRYSTFVEQIKTAYNINAANFLDTLTYLVANNSVLSASKSKDMGVTQKRGEHQAYVSKYFSESGEDGTSPYGTKEISTFISKTLSQYILWSVSDFLKQGEKDFLEVPYDFVIFNSRILIPMSVVYEGILKGLQNFYKENDLKANGVTFNARTIYKGTYDLQALYEKKLEAAREGNAEDQLYSENVLEVGYSAGAAVYPQLFINHIKLQIDAKNLVQFNLQDTNLV